MLLKVLVAGVAHIVDAESVGQAKSWGLKKIAESVVVDKNVGAADLVGLDLATVPVIRAPEKTAAQKAAAELVKNAKTDAEKEAAKLAVTAANEAAKADEKAAAEQAAADAKAAEDSAE